MLRLKHSLLLVACVFWGVFAVQAPVMASGIAAGDGAQSQVTDRFFLCDMSLHQQERDMCYHYVGIELNDSSACERVSSQYISNRCYVQIGAGMDRDCHMMAEGPDRDWCYFRGGVGMGYPLLCDLVEDSEIRDLCMHSLAVNERDPSLCEMIPEPGMAGICRYHMGVLAQS